MNTQLERFMHSMRRGIEAHVRSALSEMEMPSKKDVRELQKILEEVRESILRVEALKPYISALHVALHKMVSDEPGAKGGKVIRARRRFRPKR